MSVSLVGCRAPGRLVENTGGTLEADIKNNTDQTKTVTVIWKLAGQEIARNSDTPVFAGETFTAGAEIRYEDAQQILGPGGEGDITVEAQVEDFGS